MSTYKFIDRRHSALPPVRNTAPEVFPLPQLGAPVSFDGASSSPMRSQEQVTLNSWWELNMAELRAMQIKSRGLRNNLHIYRNIVKTLVKFSIGKGLVALPKSGNKAFDRRAKKYFNRWGASKRCDVRRKLNYYEQQLTTCSDMIVDGEIFRVPRLDAAGNVMFQTFRSEQCGMYGNVNPAVGWWNGIEYNEYGEALNYLFRSAAPGSVSFLFGLAEPYPGRSVQHIFDCERSNQMRGLPWCYSGLNDGIDAKDLQSLDNALRKLDAVLFGNIETPTGTMPNTFQQGGMGGLRPGSTALPFATVTDFPVTGALGQDYWSAQTESTYRWNGTAYIQVRAENQTRSIDVHGIRFPLFRTGEKLNFDKDSKSLDNLEALDREYNVVASAFCLPVEFVWNMHRLGGAAVRGIFEMGRGAFEHTQSVMVSTSAQPTYELVIGRGIMAHQWPADFPGVEPLEPPPGITGWDVCTHRGPADLTVDKGRDGRMLLELMMADKMSDEEWFTSLGEDPDDMTELIRSERKTRYQNWLDDGFPEAQFWLKELGASGSLSVANAPQQGAGLDDAQMDALADRIAGMVRSQVR